MLIKKYDPVKNYLKKDVVIINGISQKLVYYYCQYDPPDEDDLRYLKSKMSKKVEDLEWYTCIEYTIGDMKEYYMIIYKVDLKDKLF